MLDKHSVGFGEVLHNEIDRLVDMSKASYQSLPIVKPDTHLCDLQYLLKSIEEFLEPLQCLDFLVFFELQRSNLFNYYLKSFLSSFLVESQSVTKEDLNTAVNLTVDLIWKLCDGSATVQEVTQCNALHLEDIDMEKETDSLSLFARVFSDKVSPKRYSSCFSLRDVPNVLELLKNCESILVICQVCELFNLTKCLNDPDLICLVEAAQELLFKNRTGQLTVEEAIKRMPLFNERIAIEERSKYLLFKLFEELKHCKGLIQFADKNGFTGEACYRNFIQSFILITTTPCNEYQTAICGNLLGCFDFISSFLKGPSSFKELIEIVINLPNIEHGISQLRIVNANMSLIETWFEVCIIFLCF